MTKKAKGRLTRRRRFRDLSKRERREEVAPLDVSMTTSRWIIDDPLAPIIPYPGWAEVLRQRNDIMAAQALAGSFYTPDAGRLFNGTTAAPVPQEPLTIAAFQRSIEEITAQALEAEYRAIRERLDAQLYQQLFGRDRPMGMVAAGGEVPPPNWLGIDWAYPRGVSVAELLMIGLAGPNARFRFPRVETETAARARERARGLLKSLLTPAQWAKLDRSGTVTEQINGREFVLRVGGMIEVRAPFALSRGDGSREFWCVAPDDQEEWLPPEDKLIGQLLHLRAGPDKLREAANIFPGR